MDFPFTFPKKSDGWPSILGFTRLFIKCSLDLHANKEGLPEKSIMVSPILNQDCPQQAVGLHSSDCCKVGRKLRGQGASPSLLRAIQIVFFVLLSVFRAGACAHGVVKAETDFDGLDFELRASCF
jgi:hypothetical protein